MKGGDAVDERVGVCPICGGFLEYISCTNTIICDTCDYRKEEAY